MSARPDWARAALLVAAAISALGLSGCASFGGNVKGSFSCAAPNGICAPSSSIDDRALAMISGDAAADVVPAGPYREQRPSGAKVTRTAATPSARTAIASADAGRTQEKVLRIVFQPYIDDRGRLHEASAVHAVVAQGEWQQQAIAAASPIPPRNALAALHDTSLAEAVDQRGAETVASVDPDLPNPAAVAAARARAADPVGAIKADVAARLATKPAPSQHLPADAARQAVRGDPDHAPTLAKAPPSTPTAGAVAKPDAPQVVAVQAKPDKTVSGAEATARIKADERYVTAARAAEDTARKAAGEAAVPNVAPVLKPTVSAAAFPGAVQEDN